MKKRIKKIVLSVIVVLALSLQIFSFVVHATSPFDVIGKFWGWVVGQNTFDEFADTYLDAYDVFGIVPGHNPDYEYDSEKFRQFGDDVGLDVDGAFDDYVTNGGLNHEGGGRGGRRYQYYVKTNHRMTDPAAYTGSRRSEMIWYFNIEEDDPFFPVYYSGTYYINTGSVKVTDCVMYLKRYDQNDFSLYYQYSGSESKILPNHPDGYIWRLTSQSDGIDNTNYYVLEHNLPLEWPSGVNDTKPPSIDYPVGGGLDNDPSLDYITEAELIAFIDYLLANMPQDPPPETDLSGLEDILNAILDKINDITVGLTDNPEFEWPPMPEFEWPEMPEFEWPEPPKLEWPEPPELVWPPMPEFKWPPMPEFEWPELPKLPEIIDNTPILIEIRDAITGNNGNSGNVAPPKKVVGTLYDVAPYDNNVFENLSDWVFNHNKEDRLKVIYDGDVYWLEADGTLEYPVSSGDYYYVDMNYFNAANEDGEGGFWGFLKVFAKGIIDTIQTAIKSVVDLLSGENGLISMIRDFFSGEEGLFSLIKSVFNDVIGLIERILEFIEYILGDILTAVSNIFIQVTNLINDNFKFKDNFKGFIDKSIDGFIEALDNDNEAPVIRAKMSFMGVDVDSKVVDFSYFNSYMPTVRTLISFILLLKSILRKWKRLPSIIGQVR